jgi:F420-non-reducing hydrogenase iron-sulfur subunit
VRLLRQWRHEGARVLVREVPCTGKMDAQYLCHAIEGGLRGVCVLACPKGECHLAQGNYRAEVRIATLQRLLAEIGLEPERARLVHVACDSPAEQFDPLVRDAVAGICALGESPLRQKGERPLLPERPATKLRSVPGCAQTGAVPFSPPKVGDG